MENRKITFEKEKARSFMKVSSQFLADIEINIMKVDCIYQELAVSMDALFYSALADEKILTYYCPRPTFLDWLLRRKKVVKFKLKVKDLLLNPPVNPNITARGYFTEELPDFTDIPGID